MKNQIKTLKSEIVKSSTVLARVEQFIVEFESNRLDRGNLSIDQAMILAQSLTNYYTCLETIFLRVSRYFENSLPSSRWHQALLEKMTLEIEGVRIRVICDEVKAGLLELMKFRHFARYYFELDYDWDKLFYLLKKFHDIRKPVKKDLKQFCEYLDQLTQ